MKGRLDSEGRVVVPMEVREKFGLTKGSMLSFEVSGGAILVRAELSPEEVVDRFLSVKGRKRGKVVDWKSTLYDECRVPRR